MRTERGSTLSRMSAGVSAVALLSVFGACRTQAPQPSPSPSAPAPAVAASPVPAPSPSLAPAKAPAADPRAALRDPSRATAQAPASFRVRFDTTRGSFVVAVTRAWAPRGADRFYNLVQAGFYDDAGFFRVVPGFVVQFGLNGDPQVNAVWRDARIADDPVTQTNAPGRITFATAGPATRTTQLFINLGNNGGLDGMGFAPFGEVVSGMEVVRAIYPGYGESLDQGLLTQQGNGYLRGQFPRLDFVKKATVLR